MFLDEKGEKISKSIGNGLSVDEWLRYASPESLSYFMFQKPKSAKRLFFDVIPKSIDEYFSHLRKFKQLEGLEKYNSPIWHIHGENSPNYESEINFNSLLNLVSVCNSTDKNLIWGFLKEYDSSLSIESNPEYDSLIQYSINYYQDFVLPNKQYLKISKENEKIFNDLKILLETINNDSSSEEIQTEIYAIGKKYKFSNLRDFFKLIYQVLLGQEEGPRLGSFIKLYGIKKTANLIDKILKADE